MKYHLLPLPIIAAGFMASCDSNQTTEEPAELKPVATTPAVPAPDLRLAIEAQPLGKKLLGNTVRLVGDEFQPADLTVVPEAYFVYYSASW